MENIKEKGKNHPSHSNNITSYLNLLNFSNFSPDTLPLPKAPSKNSFSPISNFSLFLIVFLIFSTFTGCATVKFNNGDAWPIRVPNKGNFKEGYMFPNYKIMDKEWKIGHTRNWKKVEEMK